MFKKSFLVLGFLLIFTFSLTLTGYGTDNIDVEQNANSILNDFFFALENEDIDMAGNYLSSDFKFKPSPYSDDSQGKVTFLNSMKEVKFKKIKINNKIIEVINDNKKVEITGGLIQEKTLPEGNRFYVDYVDKVKFVIEKKNNKWYITYKVVLPDGPG